MSTDDDDQPVIRFPGPRPAWPLGEPEPFIPFTEWAARMWEADAAQAETPCDPPALGEL
jgi:hypothetical protein